jgi:iron uptake system component EfeO
MSFFSRRAYTVFTTVVVLALATGCASKSAGSSSTGGTTVSIALTSQGCVPSPASVPAGLMTFAVTNKNADAVTEAELLKGETILGEKENVVPGLSGTFSLRLGAGKYVVNCPNAKTEHADFVVTGVASSPAPNPSTAALAAAAGKGYHDYVVNEVNQLVAGTATFTTAVKAGDVAAAEAAFGPARTYYESIEPVAESFGDLDPAIDARIDDVTNASDWTGFHRIEKALWTDHSLAGMDPIADKLTADVAKLQSLVATQAYQPAQIANGAVELLDEVAKSKVTGEEDRYSHTDLYDFEANVDGAQEAFAQVTPLLNLTQPSLVPTLQARFADVLEALQQYHQGAGWVDYSTVDQAARRALAQKVDALAEPLSTVAAYVG